MHFLHIVISLAVAAASIDSSAQEAAAVRQLCSAGKSHAEVRACLHAKAELSARELRQAEDEMRKAIASWDQEPTDVRKSKAAFESSASEFVRHRQRHCEFAASLAAGGNSQGDLRLSCVYELNGKRIIEIRQARVILQ